MLYGEASNRGFKPRENFDNLSQDIKNELICLELFFDGSKNINPIDFFRASFKYLEVDYLPLNFFLKRKAIYFYNKVSTTMLSVHPDSEESLESFKNGIYFIGNFLKDVQKTLKDYPYLVNNNRVPYWLLHLKEHKINFYHVHAFYISPSEEINDYKELMIPEFDKKFEATRQAYYTSGKLKELGNKISKLIK